MTEDAKDSRPSEPGGGASPFAHTQWSLVILAARGGSKESEAALELLCKHYWFPIYAFIRRSGHAADAAQDLTQEFFARLLEKKWLEAVDSSKGRFRTFLLTAVTRFLANEQDRARALKRGGGQSPLSLDETDAEGRYLIEPMHEGTPERMFEVRWAETLLAKVLHRLRREFEAAGRGDRFEKLKAFLTADQEELSYAEAARVLGLSESAVKSGIFRLRSRYAELIREEIGQTLVDSGDVEDEIRHLLDMMG